ncbi:type II secretion system protein J [Candidatus Margulisiibacteriota bacterium]
MRTKGFTLVEMIVTLSIFAMLMGSVFHILDIELKLWDRLVSASEKQQVANLVLTRIVRDVRAAKEIGPASSNEELVLTIGADTIEYALVNKKVRRRKNGKTSYLTDADDLEPLSFSYPAYKIVGIKLGDNTTRAYLRN